VTGLALSRSVTRLAFVDIPDRPGVAAALFEPLAREGIAVDMIVQSVGLDGKNIIALTVEDADASRAHALVRERAEALGGRSAGDPVPLAKISAVGMALRQSSGAARTMFAALAREGINIEGIATSEIRISCLVAREAAERGLRAVHAAFGLDEVEEEEPVPASPAGKAPVGA
jgi:aspartate kinase